MLDTVIDSGGDLNAALVVLSEAVVTAAQEEAPVSLADGELLNDVYTDAGVPAAQIDNLVTQTQETVQNIENAATLDDISDVQAGDLVSIAGGNGKDTLTGTDANERIAGGNGNDVLNGMNGSDLLSGGNGVDALDGDAGNDVIVGGKGNDISRGGAGSDIFIFDKADGSDVIKDFVVGTDWLFRAPGNTITGKKETGGGTVLSLSKGGSITLEGVIGIGNVGDLATDSLPLWAHGWAIA